MLFSFRSTKLFWSLSQKLYMPGAGARAGACNLSSSYTDLGLMTIHSMGVSGIFSKEGLDWIFPGGETVVKIHFASLKLNEKHFLLKTY